MAGTGEGRGVATVRMVRVCVCVCACVCVHGRVDGFGRAPATLLVGVCGVCVRVRWRTFFWSRAMVRPETLVDVCGATGGWLLCGIFLIKHAQHVARRGSARGVKANGACGEGAAWCWWTMRACVCVCV